MNYRKPTELKILSGSFREDRDHVDVRTETDLPDKIETPGHLGSAGKKQWRKLIKLLKEEELLKKVDLGCLEACCMAYDEMVQSNYDIKMHRQKQEAAEKDLALAEDKDEVKAQISLVEHHTRQIGSARNTKHKAMSLYHKFMNEFGLYSGSRKLLDLTEGKPEESEFEKMFGVMNGQTG